VSDLTAVALATAGAGFAVAKPVAEAASDLAQKLLGEPFEVAGSMLADKMYYWQCVNRIKVLEKLRTRLDKTGIPLESLPAGFLIPALEAAGNVEDDELQQLWASLLYNAIEERSSRSPMYLNVLRQLGAREARWLNEHYRQLRKEHVEISKLDGTIVHQLIVLGLLKHPHPEFSLELKDAGDFIRSSDPVEYDVRQWPIEPDAYVILSEFGELFALAIDIEAAKPTGISE